MNLLRRLAVVVSCLAVHQVANAQHCAPIYSSYLSDISVKASKEGIKCRLEYTKAGGARREAYQAYVVAYWQRDTARVPAVASKEVIDTEVALVVHTQLIQRNAEGRFAFEFVIDEDDLAKKMIALGKMTDKDRVVNGGWGAYKDQVRLAVFIPFLDDKKYSVIEGLPKERHECNYLQDRALLFQALPGGLGIHFGISRGAQLAEGKFVMEINGDKPPKQGGQEKLEK